MASTKLSHQDPNPNMEYHQQEDIAQDYESELDVLSLCDLPIYSSESTDQDQDYNSKELYNNDSSDSFSSSYEDQENFFEFFSEEWNIWNISTKTTTSISKFNSSPLNDEHFIFCGKIIPSKQSLSNERKTLELKTTQNKIPQEISQEKKSSLIPWKSHSMFFRSKSKSRGQKCSDKNDVLVPKVSIYTAPVKSKLLLVLFGLPPKIPNHTELMTDIRNRQSRHSRSTFFPENGSGCDKEVVAVRRRSIENGLWRFIKAATCFGGQPRGNDVV